MGYHQSAPAGLHPRRRHGREEVSIGNRGYRAVQFEAGAAGGRLYPAAYAQRLGAAGLTFFDDEVTEFFSPHARGRSVIFHMAFRRPARRSSLP